MRGRERYKQTLRCIRENWGDVRVRVEVVLRLFGRRLLDRGRPGCEVVG